MSDISALSNQYDQLVDTSEKINNSVIAFKKQNLLQDATTKNKYPGLKISPEEVNYAGNLLLRFLSSIFENLGDGKTIEEEFMPVVVKEDYASRLRKNTAYFDEDLKKLHGHLQQKQPVTGDDIRVMDMLVTTLDTERSNLFRKLRTARG